MPEIDNQSRHSNAVWRALTSGKIREATAMLREKGMESLSNPKLSILEDVLPLALQSLASSYDQHGIVGDEDRYFELARELWRFMSDTERGIPEMVCTFLYAGCKFNQPGFVRWILPIVASHPSIEMHGLAADRQYQFNQLRHSAVYYIARNGNIDLYDLLASACGGVSPLLLECAHYDAQALSVTLQGTATRPRGLSLGTSSLADAFSQDTMLAGTAKGGEAADPPSLYVALRAGQTAFARHCLAGLPAQDQARVLRLTVVYGILPADDIDVAKALYAICCEPAQDSTAPHPVDMPRALAESPSDEALYAGPQALGHSDTASVASQSGPASGGGGGGSTSALSPTVASRLVETASCIFGFGAGRDVSQGPIVGIPRSRTVSEASVSLLSTISDTNTVASSAFPPTVTSATAPAPLLSSEAGTSLFSPFHCYAWHLCFFTSEGSAEPTVRRKRHAVRYAAWLLRTFRLAVLQPLSRMRWSGATAILHPFHPSSSHDVFGNASQGQQSGHEQHEELTGVRVRSSAVQASPSRLSGQGPGLPFAPPAYWSDWTPLHSAAAAPSPDLLQRLLAVDKGQLLKAAVGVTHGGSGTVELSEKDAADAGEPSALRELYAIRVAVETCLWTAQFETPRVLAQWLTAPQLEVQLYCASRVLGLAQAKPAFIKSLCKETGVLTMRPFKHGPIPIQTVAEGEAGRDTHSGLGANPDAGVQQSIQVQVDSSHAPARSEVDRVVSPPPERLRTPVPRESPTKATAELAAEGRREETGGVRGAGRDPSPTDSPNLEVIAQSHGARAAAQAHSKQAAPLGSVHGAEAASMRHFRARGVSAGSLGSASTGTVPSVATKSAVGIDTLVDTNSGGSGSRRGSSVSGTAEFEVLSASERQSQALGQHQGHTGLMETDFQQVQSHKGKRKKTAAVAVPVHPVGVTGHRAMPTHAKEKGSQATGPVAQGSTVVHARAHSSAVVQESKAHAERSGGGGAGSASASHNSSHGLPPPPPLTPGDKTDGSTSQRSLALAVAGRSDEQNVCDVEEDKAAAAGQEMRDTLIAASVQRSRSVAGLAALSHSPERAMHSGAAGGGAAGSGIGASSTPKPARLTSAPSVQTVQDSAIARPVPLPHAGRAEEEDETLIPQGSVYHSNSYMSPPRSVSSSVGGPEPSYDAAPSTHHDRTAMPPYRAGSSSQGSASDDVPSEASISGRNLPLYDAISAGLDAALGLAPGSRVALSFSSPPSAQQKESQQQQGKVQLQPVPFALPPVPAPAHRGDARKQAQGVTHPMGGQQQASPSLLKLTAASLLIEVDTSSSGLLSAACGPLRSNLYSGTIHGVACGVRGVDLRVTPLPLWYAHAVQALSVAWPSVVHVAGAAAAHVPAALRLQLTSASNTPLPGQARPIRCFCIATDSTGGGNSDGQQQAPTDLLWLVVEQCTHAQQLSASTLLMPSTPGLPPGNYSTRCKLVFELLSILSRYHAAGMVHGCVQPGAVRVDPEGSVLLAHTFQAQAWLYGAIEVAEGALRSGKPPARAIHACTTRLSACLQGLLSYMGEWSAPETLAVMHEACDMATAVQSLGTPGRVTFAVGDEHTGGGSVQGSMQGQQESIGTAYARLQTMIGHAKAVLARLSSAAQDSYTAGLTAYTLLTGGAASNGHACGPAWARQAAILSGRHALSDIVGPGGTLTESGQVQARVLGLLPLHAMAVAALLAHNPADRAPVASVVQAFRV